MNIIIKYLLILNFLAPHNTLPHRMSQNREPRNINPPSEESKSLRKDEKDCSSDVIFVNNQDDCSEENQISLKVLACLNNCANCVKQWRTGVYNGNHCANDCMKQHESAVESMDPDCNRMKYFNSTLLASV